MTEFLALLAIAVTMGGQAALRLSDAKRRRVFSLPAKRFASMRFLARLAVWLPGIGLAWAGNYAGLTIWMGAVTVSGWGIACLTPTHVALARARLAETTARAVAAIKRQLIHRPSRHAAAQARIRALEARVAELEAELAAQTPTRAPLAPVAASGPRS